MRFGDVHQVIREKITKHRAQRLGRSGSASRCSMNCTASPKGRPWSQEHQTRPCAVSGTLSGRHFGYSPKCDRGQIPTRMAARKRNLVRAQGQASCPDSFARYFGSCLHISFKTSAVFFPASRTVSAAARSELSGLLLLSAKRVVDVPGRAQRMLASVEFDAAFMTVALLCAAISSSTDRRLA